MKKILIVMLIVLLVLVGCQNKASNPATSSPLSGSSVADVPSTDSKSSDNVVSTQTVFILGKEGFSPAETTINSGSMLQWSNRDDQHKIVVLTIHKEKSNVFITSPEIKAEDSWSYVFNDLGQYTYWTVGYGAKAKLTVQ